MQQFNPLTYPSADHGQSPNHNGFYGHRPAHKAAPSVAMPNPNLSPPWPSKQTYGPYPPQLHDGRQSNPTFPLPEPVTMPVPEPYSLTAVSQYETQQSAPWSGYSQGPAFPVPDRAAQWPGGFATPYPGAPHPQPYQPRGRMQMQMPIPHPAPVTMPLPQPALGSDYANFPSPSSASSTYSSSSSPTTSYRGYH